MVLTEQAPEIILPDLGARIGLVAGNGKFPIDFAKKIRSLGKALVVIGFDGETDPSIAEFAESLHWIKVGQLAKLLALIQEAKISHLAFAGGVSRVKLFRNAWPDIKALSLAAKLGTIKDDVILRAIAKEVEDLGIVVVNGALYLDQAVPKAGLLSKRALSEDELDDALVGWRAAKIIGASDIGQSVIVYKSLVIAVEAVEGTDEAIRRAGALAQQSSLGKRQSGPVLVKVSKPQQDKRLDVPAIGPTTISEMARSGITALIVEANATMLISPEEVVAACNKHEIAFYSCQDGSELIVGVGRARDFRLQ